MMNVRRPAIIVDRDGTLFSVEHHKHNGEISDWESYNGLAAFDAPVPWVAAILRSVRPGIERIITSGRVERVRRSFVAALDKHDIPYDYLFMRSDGDTRRDSTVKLELYREKIEPYFDVKLCIDDRPQVIEAWKSIGLHVITVRDPGIEPRLIQASLRLP